MGKSKSAKAVKGYGDSTEINWRTPGLELNDIGYMQISDEIKQENNLSYFVNKPVSVFRTYNISLGQYNAWNFGRDHLYSSAELELYFEFLNKWAISTGVSYTSTELDTRLLRGGGAMLVPRSGYQYFYIRTDASKKLSFYLNTSLSQAGNKRAGSYSFSPGSNFRPVNNLNISLDAGFSSNFDELQYVGTINTSQSTRYIVGKIDQKTFNLTLKIDYNLTPEISLQYYGSPFASIGRYKNYKSVIQPRNSSYNQRFLLLADPVINGTTCEIDENNDHITDYSFDNPDFDFYQFRSNLVFRWEYRPGSQLYLVWSNERTNSIVPGAYDIGQIPARLGDAYPDNIFLIKFNYWFTL